MTTLTLETILDSELNNQPATKADLRNLGMHFESQFAMVDARFAQVDARFAQVDARLTELDTKITNLGTEIRQDLAAFKLEIRQTNIESVRTNIYIMIGFALTAIGAIIAAPFFQ
jgi:uncharacterized protein involved in exopolysaccharide biosynthesis